MVQEFREFINRGNVVDLAVAVILAAAFTPIVTAIVDRLIMPMIGLVFGQPNFDAIGTFACAAPTEGAEGIVNAAGQLCQGSIGAVLTAVVSFLLVALAVFFIVKAYNARLGPPEEEAPAGPNEVELLTQIRDALQRGNSQDVVG